MECFVINLDRVPRRWAFTQAEFARLALVPQRFAAIDAHRLDSVDGVRYQPHDGPRWELTASAVACFESHRRLWAEIAARDLPVAAIFEDDMALSDDLPAVLALLDPGDDEVIKLDSAINPHRVGPPVRELGRWHLHPIIGTSTSTGAYVLTAGGARRLLALSETYCDHIDEFVLRTGPGWRPLQLMPVVACQLVKLTMAERGALGADDPQLAGSERESDPAINRPRAKAPLGWRLAGEARRAARRLFWSTWGDRHLRRSGGMTGDGQGSFRRSGRARP